MRHLFIFWLMIVWVALAGWTAVEDAQAVLSKNEGWFILKVDNKLMEPYYGKNDIVVVMPVKKESIMPGMLVVFNSLKKYYGRIVERMNEHECWVREGLDDPDIGLICIRKQDIIGSICIVFNTQDSMEREESGWITPLY